MPRKPRLFFPDQAVHIVKRGHNRDPIVRCRTDYEFFVDCLKSASKNYGVALHAWVLMTNHFHLLASPKSDLSVPEMMQWLGGYYARYFNRRYGRSGSLWEGRYKASLIDSEAYLLKCYRYIELNPVRASLVEHPEQYSWSSYGVNANGLSSLRGNMLTPHQVYLDLSNDVNKRLVLYRALFQDELDRRSLVQLRRGINKNRSVGSPEFLLKMRNIHK